MNDIRSISGNKWLFSSTGHESVCDEVISRVSSMYCISDFVSRYILNRLKLPECDIADFLDSKIKNYLSHIPANVLTDMDKAVDLIVHHIKLSSKIAIFGDYDVDGACSSALLKNFLLHCKVADNNIILYIPDRVKEGYGPNSAAMTALKEAGVNLIITVDCGIVAFEPITVARQLGMDVIVLDHHSVSSDLPPANAVINPKRNDDLSGFGYLCAAGVVFLFCIAIASVISNSDKTKLMLMLSLDIVALATVCDVVPLIGLNRAFVRQGLKVINNGSKNIGLSALCKAAAIDGTISAKHLGFNIGPMINAGGRVGNSLYGATLLSQQDCHEASKLAAILASCNKTRVEIEKKMTSSAIDTIGLLFEKDVDKNVVFAYSPDWHEGVIGIVAARMQEMYKKPAIVGSVVIGEDNIKYVKASCRSIPSVDVGKIVLECVGSGIAIKGGGHAAAAGFTARLDRISELSEYFEKRVCKMIENSEDHRYIVIDSIVSMDAVFHDSFLIDFAILEPFGRDNPSPVFLARGILILKTEKIKGVHVKILFRYGSSGSLGNAILFRGVGTTLGNELMLSVGKKVDLVFNVMIDFFGGRETANIVVCDAMYAN